MVGSQSNLQAERDYQLEVRMHGSKIEASVDGAIFYDNTIEGKSKVEDLLQKHLAEIFIQST
jgi:fructose-bisphosphate aldolase class 1